MTPEQAMKAYQYVRRYGKNWTKEQVGRFFIAVASLAQTVAVRKGAGDDR